MAQKKERKQISGSITMFLAMIFMLIVSLILVTLESARISAIKSCVSMAMTQSMDSVLAQYYRPLFEEYHLFGRYQEEETEESRRDALQQEMLESIGYLSNPKDGLLEVSEDVHCVLPVTIDSLTIDEIAYLGDYETDELYSQATQAVQFFGLQSLTDKILEGTNLLSDTAKASKAFAMQAKAEEELAGLEATVLELMRLIDGITVKDGSVQFHKNGWLECEDSFVKIFVSMPVKMETVKIDQEFIYYCLASNYEDKDNMYTFCIQTLNVLSDLLVEREEKETECNEASHKVYVVTCSMYELEQQQALLYTLKSEKETELKQLEEASKENEKRRLILTSEIEQLDQQIQEIQLLWNDKYEECTQRQSELDLLEEQYEKIENSIREKNVDAQMRIEEVDVVLLEVMDLLDETIQKMLDAIIAQKEAQGIVTDYEDSLEEIVDEIPEEMSSVLVEELNTMKEAVGLEESDNESTQLQYDYEAMLETLQYDYDLLNNQIRYLSYEVFLDDFEGVQKAIQILEKNQENLSRYSIDNLEFDYSTFNLHPQEENKVLDSVQNVFSQGITNLVVEDSDEISEKELELTDLVSTHNKVENGEIKIGEPLSSKSSWDGGMVSDLFDTFSGLFGGEQSISEGITDLVNMGLFQTYIQYYFKDYINEENPKIETVLYPSAIDYEKEYICFHKASDAENLSSMIETTFFLRLIVNLIELYSNSECTKKAQATATALMSFTGMSFLITIMKLLILMVWAVVEALTDVATMIRGTKVALFDSKKVHFEYEELLTVNKQQIQAKAKKYEAKGGVALGYDEYLFIYLFMQSKQSKCYGVMDIIQENLNYRYEGGFQLTRCICELKTTLHYRIENLYALGISYGNSLTGRKTLTAGY